MSRGYYDQYYLKAAKVRELIRGDFEEAFKRCDLIVTPTSPTPAWKIGEKIDDPLKMYLSDIFTIPANLAGIPAISIPCGFTPLEDSTRQSKSSVRSIKERAKDSLKGFTNELPVGLQILGKPFKEEEILQAAYAYEQATEWHLQKPEL